MARRKRLYFEMRRIGALANDLRQRIYGGKKMPYGRAAQRKWMFSAVDFMVRDWALRWEELVPLADRYVETFGPAPAVEEPNSPQDAATLEKFHQWMKSETRAGLDARLRAVSEDDGYAPGAGANTIKAVLRDRDEKIERAERLRKKIEEEKSGG